MDRRGFVATLTGFVAAVLARVLPAAPAQEAIAVEVIPKWGPPEPRFLTLTIPIPGGVDPWRALLSYRWHDDTGSHQYLGPILGSPHATAAFDGEDLVLSFELECEPNLTYLTNVHVQAEVDRLAPPRGWHETPLASGPIRPYKAARPGRQRSQGWR